MLFFFFLAVYFLITIVTQNKADFFLYEEISGIEVKKSRKYGLTSFFFNFSFQYILTTVTHPLLLPVCPTPLLSLRYTSHLLPFRKDQSSQRYPLNTALQAIIGLGIISYIKAERKNLLGEKGS